MPLLLAGPGGGPGPRQFRQVDAIKFAPDICQPVPDIAAQHEGVVRGFIVPSLICDEVYEWDGCDFHLFIGHLIKLRYGQLSRMFDAVKIGTISRLVPLEELSVVDEVLDQVVLCPAHESRGFRDLVQRSDG